MATAAAACAVWTFGAGAWAENDQAARSDIDAHTASFRAMIRDLEKSVAEDQQELDRLNAAQQTLEKDIEQRVRSLEVLVNRRADLMSREQLAAKIKELTDELAMERASRTAAESALAQKERAAEEKEKTSADAAAQSARLDDAVKFMKGELVKAQAEINRLRSDVAKTPPAAPSATAKPPPATAAETVKTPPAPTEDAAVVEIAELMKKLDEQKAKTAEMKKIADNRQSLLNKLVEARQRDTDSKSKLQQEIADLKKQIDELGRQIGKK
jgi:DNA repair exonuclease SbcCD ATPase subunit